MKAVAIIIHFNGKFKGNLAMTIRIQNPIRPKIKPPIKKADPRIIHLRSDVFMSIELSNH